MTCVLSYRRFSQIKMYEFSMALGIVEPVDHWEVYTWLAADFRISANYCAHHI